MKMLLSLDFFLWNHFIPRISAEFFKNKINSSLAMTYISMYKLPRKFLIHYFRGKGQTMNVDSRQLITRNSAVLNKLVTVLQFTDDEKQVGGFLDICQTDVYQPNDKYSIGSFRINYSRIGETVQVNILSNYRFQESPDRITKHLHHWLFTLKNKGKASDFAIEGNNWTIQMNELFSMKNQQKLIPDLRGKLLV
ncbi:MAG TPA: hypothetical protein VKA38_15150 [Draconibacterium sp.]|nr:hypothetical protein [Draconibacterium sp.]